MARPSGDRTRERVRAARARATSLHTRSRFQPPPAAAAADAECPAHFLSGRTRTALLQGCEKKCLEDATGRIRPPVGAARPGLAMMIIMRSSSVAQAVGKTEESFGGYAFLAFTVLAHFGASQTFIPFGASQDFCQCPRLGEDR